MLLVRPGLLFFLIPALIGITWQIGEASGGLNFHGLEHQGGAGEFFVWPLFFMMGFHDPFARVPKKKRGFLSGFLRLRDWWEMVRKFGKEPTAKWASLIEVMSHDYAFGDIFLGRPWTIFGGMKRPVGIATEKHMVTIAGTGSGKSTAALIPNLCVYPGSVLCIDPKGELARITAWRRGSGGNGVKGLGQGLVILDPFHITEYESPSYNPFVEMEYLARESEDAVVSFANILAEALVKPTQTGEPYFQNAAKTLIGGLVLFIFVHEIKAQKNLIRLRELLLYGDVDTYEAYIKAGKLKKGQGTPFDVLLERMAEARRGKYGGAIAGAVSGLTIMGGDQFGSVVSTAQEQTKFLDNPEIQKICRKSHFLLSSLKKELWSIYVCLPLNNVMGPEVNWLRMFVLLFIDVMMRTKEKPWPPVLLAIDEFPNLGRLDGIELVAPTMRSYGVRMWVVGQDISQFKAVYPDTWTGFLGGAEAIQFMGLTHQPTLDFLVDLLGQHEVRRVTGQEVRREVRHLLDREQMARFLDVKKGNQIVWFGRQRSMRLKIAPYYEYLPPWYYDPDPHYPEPFFRQLYRKWKPKRGRGDSLDYDVEARDGGSDPPPPPPPSYPPPPPKNEVLPDQKNDDFWKQLAKQKWQKDEKSTRTDSGLTMGEGPVVPPVAPEEIPNVMAKKSAIAELEEIKFQDEVVEEIRSLVDLVELQKKRAKKGMPQIPFSHHMVFTGNPGTGKTTVARIVGRIFKELGILKAGHFIEVGRGDLVGSYIGETAQKTREVIAKAMDGLLFIDEAYTLSKNESPRDFGGEAIAELLTAMENYRDRIVLIAAGYPKEMEGFIKSNPGLESRFKTFIHFEDYDPMAVNEMFTDMCTKAGCRVSVEASKKAYQMLMVRYLIYGTGDVSSKSASWGNGRLARNIFEEAIKRQARRVARQKNADIRIIEEDDIPDISEGT